MLRGIDGTAIAMGAEAMGVVLMVFLGLVAFEGMAM